MLSATEERRLLTGVRTAVPDADSGLLAAFEPMVAKAAKAYLRAGARDVDFDDLAQAAREAVIIAARDFDLSRSNRFSSFVRFRIRAALQSALAESEPVSASVSEWRLRRRVAAIANRQRDEGIRPTAATVAQELPDEWEAATFHFNHPVHTGSLELAENTALDSNNQARQAVVQAATNLYRRLNRVPQAGELAADLGIELDVILGALAGDSDDGRDVKAALKSTTP